MSSFMWKIENGELKPSFLFGTMHYENCANKIAPEVKTAMQSCERVILEFDTANLATQLPKFMHLAFLPKSNLEDLIGKEAYKNVAQAMVKLGIPEILTKRATPHACVFFLHRHIFATNALAAFSFFMMPQIGDVNIMDLKLAKYAVSIGKPISWLESIIDLFSSFDSFSTEDAISLLQGLDANLLDSNERRLDEIASIYQKGDILGLQTFQAASAAGVKKTSPVFQRLNRMLSDDRTVKWMPAITEYLLMGGSFIAAGTFHLIGTEGVLKLLRLQGYKVSPV